MRKSIEKNARAHNAIEVRGSIYETQQSFIVTRSSRNDNGLLLQPPPGASTGLYRIKDYSVTTSILTVNANNPAPADSTDQFCGKIWRGSQY
jgi:hypothetical protein